MVNAGCLDIGWTGWVPQVIAVAVLLVQGVIMWVLWSLKKEFVRKDDCTKCSTEMITMMQELQCSRSKYVRKDECTATSAGLTGRVASMQSELDKLPSSESWAAMQVAIEEVRGSNRVLLAKIEGQSEVLKKIEHPLQLLMEFHIKGNER